MATPRPSAVPESKDGQAMPAAAPGHAVQEAGLQYRPMGLKVHYTFDSEAKVNCLARLPYTLHVQAVSLGEATVIGIVDLRACIQALIECSPELAGSDGDYTIYAVDYSEPDTPLVGQGMLSWAVDSMQGPMAAHLPKLVTGRVTKNLLGVFGGGNRETLEVRLKLSASAKIRRHALGDNMDMQQSRAPAQTFVPQSAEQAMERLPERHADMVMTPTGTSEWDSFLQSNPQFGRTSHVSCVASPATSQHPPAMVNHQGSLGPPPIVVNHQESFGPPPTVNSQEPLGPSTSQELHRVAPTPVEPTEQAGAPAALSRPSSRASSGAARKRPPTGRPRGRPRRKPADGNTSAYEEATDGDEGPIRKRPKTTKAADKVATNPFAAGPESLRVAASTSGSLRSFRPVAASEGASASHLQETPRAPTPVPGGGPFGGLPGRGPSQSKLRREPSQSQHQAAGLYLESRLQPLCPGQENGRSPESMAPTPAYSDASMASSPPMHRTTPFIRSSPPPSSPVLPPMPSGETQHHDSSFANDEMDDVLGEERLPPAHNDRLSTHTHRDKPTELKTANGVPVQVFQMKDGPTGQDMVHICSYNGAPHPAPNPAPPESSDAPCLPPLKKDNARPRPKRAPAKKRSRAAPRPHLPPPPAPPPRAMEPTPPPTTDTMERPVSPLHTTESVQDDARTAMVELAPDEIRPIPVPAAEPMQDTIQPNERNTSPGSTVSTAQTAAQQQDRSSERPSQRGSSQSSKQRKPQPIVRSQSTGAMALALAAVPASEPAGPSSLCQSTVAEPGHPISTAAPVLERAASSGPLILPVPASDPVVPSASSQQVPSEVQREASVPPSEAAPPASSPPAVRSNKNIVKKHAIKQRLEEAIMNGEMPPFCSNCGAIETPTWRKIWVQDHEGTPEYCEYSEKPGKVTAIEITSRDAEENPMSYRLVKKSLGAADDKGAWQELLLCNPCGIWLTKCKCHRPPDRWDKDLSRIGQERRRKGTGRSGSRSKRPRSKSDALINTTSEAYLPTDALGPGDPSSPKAAAANGRQGQGLEARAPSADLDSGNHSDPSSSHSRNSGTARSPVELDFDEAVGRTKRLLFPSPRKEGHVKVLGEVDMNVVQVSDELQQLKRLVAHVEEHATVEGRGGGPDEHDDLEALFRSPAAARPSTPTAGTGAAKVKTGGSAGAFRTPTRRTPNRRPMTRSVSRSLRSIRSIASPSQIFIQQTPTKTPRIAFGSGAQGSAGRRRSPRNHQTDLEAFDTPISRSIHQIFSDPANFCLVDDLDLGSLPALETQHTELIDFGSLIEADGILPSSPGRNNRSHALDYASSANIWAQWTVEVPRGGDE